ncbi:EF-Hand 1, calcium-binding site [Nannochloropsis gaditana]|uniref:EF-Hand 1, calcium-binding site n=1 Tax=Nannochloropsis gaditana TaxID=72520 RepID=W7T0N2_9STRA|nr:EF-Hand 1, calcium-binding site [Nannochloropsis gaditana]
MSRFSILYLSIICLVSYLLVSIGVYGYWLERWGASRAIYFGVVTLTSVGFGDMTPLTQESRLFTIFFAIVGISVVALAVGEISGFIIEKETAKVEEFNRLLAQKLSQRMQADHHEAAGESEDDDSRDDEEEDDEDERRADDPREERMTEHSMPGERERGQVGFWRGSSDGETPSRDIPHQDLDAPRGNATTLEPSLQPSFPSFIRPSSWCMGASAGALACLSAWWSRQKKRWKKKRKAREKKSGKGEGKRMDPKKGKEEEENAWAKAKLGEGSRVELVKLVLRALLPVILVNAIGAGTIGYLEGWTEIDIVYYAVISSTTIGYGDLHPDNEATYLVASIYIPFAVVAVGNFVTTIAQYYVKRHFLPPVFPYPCLSLLSARSSPFSFLRIFTWKTSHAL